MAEEFSTPYVLTESRQRPVARLPHDNELRHAVQDTLGYVPTSETVPRQPLSPHPCTQCGALDDRADGILVEASLGNTSMPVDGSKQSTTRYTR